MTPSSAVQLSLVFPCYMEEPHLERNVERILETLSMLKVSYEIIFVEDCSKDGTRSVLEKVVERHPEIQLKIIYHETNQGRGAAFTTGARQSSGVIIGFFDIDLEVSPVYLVECLRRLRNEGADMVIGKRYYEVHLALLYRHILSSGYRLLVSTILRIPASIDTESGYKFFKRETLQRYLGHFEHKGWFWDTEVVTRMLWDGFKVISVPCLFLRNSDKRSTVRPFRDAVQYLYHLLKYRFSKRLPLPATADNVISLADKLQENSLQTEDSSALKAVPHS